MQESTALPLTRTVQAPQSACQSSRTPLPALFLQKHIPPATEGTPQPNSGRHEDISLARLDLLKRPDIEVGEFRQFLLGYVASNSLASQVCAQYHEFVNRDLRWHALLCRNRSFDRTA